MAKNFGVLELNDYQLQLTYNNKQYNSSGYATVNNDKGGKDIIFGEPAQQQFRRQPLNSYNQFWNQLNVDAINTNHAKLRHFADFAHQQLLEFHTQAKFEQLVIVVPASFSREQLSLLLGICQQCPFAVIGVVDSAVLSASHLNCYGKTLHLDIQLHQCLLTQLSGDEHIQITKADIIPGTGISQLFTRFAHYLSEQFIEQCRFDPAHDADSEQQLYNLLEQLINGDKAQELQLSLDGKQVNLNRQSILRHASDLFDDVLTAIEKSGPFDTLLVHQRVTAIEELYQPLVEKYGAKIQIIEQQKLSDNVQTEQQQIIAGANGLSYITRLKPTKQGTVKQQQLASHFLWQHKAYPLSATPLYISANKVSKNKDNQSIIAISKEQQVQLTQLSDKPVTINQLPVSGNQTLQLGDSIDIQAQSPIQLIAVVTTAAIEE